MIEKLIPRYLNKDDDARLIKSIEMTDALNVRISSEEDGDGGVVKNAFGNSAVVFRSGNNWQGLPHALPGGPNILLTLVKMVILLSSQELGMEHLAF